MSTEPEKKQRLNSAELNIEDLELLNEELLQQITGGSWAHDFMKNNIRIVRNNPEGL